MPKKLDPRSSQGEKAIRLFAKLMFSRQSHSLTDLARMLSCSKQTVLRLIDVIKRSYDIEIEETFEGRRKYFQIKRLKINPPLLPLTESELNSLYMCRSFAEHLLGRRAFEEAGRALEKSQAYIPKVKPVPHNRYGSFRSCGIDYTPHQGTIHKIIEAMNGNMVCKVSYKSIIATRAKTFYVMPLKIFSYYDTVYLHARRARTPGTKYRAPKYNPLLAIHRIRKIEITDRLFEYPKDYDFDAVFNESFGIIKEDPFKVEVEFTGYSAKYAVERIWSPDQQIKKKGKGKIVLIFSASSKPELIDWLLSYGNEARVIKPRWLVENMKKEINLMQEVYR